jgi:hypothetical protein
MGQLQEVVQKQLKICQKIRDIKLSELLYEER